MESHSGSTCRAGARCKFVGPFVYNIVNELDMLLDLIRYAKEMMISVIAAACAAAFSS